MKPKFKLTRGGIQYFDAGGQVLPQATAQSGDVTSGLQGANPLQGKSPGPFGNQIADTLTNTTGQIIGGVGNLSQRVGAAFTPQNGYNALLAPTTLSNYAPVIGGAVDAFGQNLSNQTSLAALLSAEGQGYGPNPALAALHNQTGQNINTQAALLAGQRGASANPGMLARQIATQGAGIQQNETGQAAALQAQQQLAAQQAAAGIYGNIGNQTGSLFTGAAGAQNTQNSGLVQNYNDAQTINSKVAQSNTDAVGKTTGGLLNSAGKLLSFLAKGGEVEDPNAKISEVPPTERLNNKFYPSHMKEMASIYHPHLLMANGGKVPADPNPISQSFINATGFNSLKKPQPESTPPAPAVASYSEGGKMNAVDGGKVPGKAKVKGDSYKNDVIDAKVSPGEVVIPRSIMQSEDPAGNAAKFVAKIASKHSSADEEDDFKMALKKAISTRGKK